MALVFAVVHHLYPAAGNAWGVLALSVTVSSLLFIMGLSLHLRRFVALAVLALGLGFVWLALHLGETLGLAAYFFALGMALMASGGFALRSVLRRNPIVTENRP
jgi:hypothetical protein